MTEKKDDPKKGALTVGGKGGAATSGKSAALAAALGGKTTTKGVAKFQGAKAAVAAPKTATTKQQALTAAVAGTGRPRLTFAVDATASRERCWEQSKRVTDALFDAVPGELDVNLAVHGGSAVHTWTRFSSDAKAFRDQAASVVCQAGQTQLLPILDRVLHEDRVRVVVYVGDVFEEDSGRAEALARDLRLRGTHVILLHDASDGAACPPAFHTIADLTQGAVIPFDPSAVDRLRDLLGAVAALAAGGRALLERLATQKTLPASKGAALLLEHLKG
jgi:hypothetical protein